MGAPCDRANLFLGGEQGSGGKLKDAARTWATGGAADLSEAAADARRDGLEELARRIEGAAQAGGKFEVWRRNWDIALAFFSVSTQWRAIARGLDGTIYWMGLDYSAARAGLDASGITITPGLWAGIQIMERAARDALNGVKG